MHCVTNGSAVLMQPTTFSINLFTAVLRRSGAVSSAIATVDYNDGVLRIDKVVDITRQVDWRFQSKFKPHYNCSKSPVEVTYQIINTDVGHFLTTRILQAKALAVDKTNVLTEGYSLTQVARWPAIQSDVSAFNTDNSVIGHHLQSCMSRNGMSAAMVSASVTPKIKYELDIFTARNRHIAALMALNTNPTDLIGIESVLTRLANYDVSSGWPEILS